MEHLIPSKESACLKSACPVMIQINSIQMSLLQRKKIYKDSAMYLRWICSVTILLNLTTGAILCNEIFVKVPTTENFIEKGRADVAEQVTLAGGSVWLAMKSGAYRVEGDNSTTAFLRGTQVKTIADVFDEVWLGTKDGIYEVHGKKAVRLTLPETIKNVRSIFQIENDILVGTGYGLFRVKCDKYKNIPSKCSSDEPLLPFYIFTILKSMDEIWVGTNKGLYRINFGSRRKPSISLQDKKIVKIRSAGGYLWFILESDTNCYQISRKYLLTDNQQRSLTVINSGEPTKKLLSVAEIQGRILFGTSDGLLSWNSKEGFQEIDADEEIRTINEIAEFDGQIWLGTVDGVYVGYFRGRRYQIVKRYLGNEVNDLSLLEGSIWAWGEDGVCRYAKNVSTRVYFNTYVSGFGKLGILWGEDLSVRGVRYVRNEESFYKDPTKEKFEIIVAETKENLEKQLQEDRFEPINAFSKKLSTRLYELHVAVRNECNDVDIPDPYVVFAIGSWRRNIVYFFITLAAFVLLGLSFPRQAWLFSVNYNFPRWAGVVHAFPILRRRIILHYAKRFQNFLVSEYEMPKVKNASEYSLFLIEDARNDGQREISFEEMLSILRERRCLLLVGASYSDIGLFMVRLFKRFAARQKLSLFFDPLRRLIFWREYRAQWVPVFFRLDSEACGATKMADIQGLFLRYCDYGRRDTRDPDSFLSAGHYLFLLHGYNKLEESARFAVRHFIARYQADNYFVVSSDGDYCDLEGLVNTIIWIE